MMLYLLLSARICWRQSRIDSLYNVAKDLNNLLPAARSHVLRTARGLSPTNR